MRKHALIKDGVVQEVRVLTDANYLEAQASCDMVFDIEDLNPQPEAGWVLQGNQLVGEVSDAAKDIIQQKAQRLFGLKLLPEAVDLIGARNFKLSREGTPADVASLASQMASIKLLLEGGALKTVRTICTALKPMYPYHADCLDYVIKEITIFLEANGWN